MLALYRCGRQADALGTYRNGRTLMSEELALEPGPSLQRLEQAILRQDATLDLPAREPGVVATAVASPPRPPDSETKEWPTDDQQLWGGRTRIGAVVAAVGVLAVAIVAVLLTSPEPRKLTAPADSLGVVTRPATPLLRPFPPGSLVPIVAGYGAVWATDSRPMIFCSRSTRGRVPWSGFRWATNPRASRWATARCGWPTSSTARCGRSTQTPWRGWPLPCWERHRSDHIRRWVGLGSERDRRHDRSDRCGQRQGHDDPAAWSAGGSRLDPKGLGDQSIDGSAAPDRPSERSGHASRPDRQLPPGGDPCTRRGLGGQRVRQDGLTPRSGQRRRDEDQRRCRTARYLLWSRRCVDR